MAKKKPILCIDFDGVIHSYDRGWGNGEIYGGVVPGFFEWAYEAHELFWLVICSSRSKSDEGRIAMLTWFEKQHNSWLNENRDYYGRVIDFEFTNEKPPAFLTIDDRALTFNGDWTDDLYRPEKLRAFQPWNSR